MGIKTAFQAIGHLGQSSFKAKSAIPAMDPVMGPDQAAFEVMLAQMASAGHPR